MEVSAPNLRLKLVENVKYIFVCIVRSSSDDVDNFKTAVQRPYFGVNIHIAFMCLDVIDRNLYLNEK